MTRETKVGLVVGTGIILLIGIIVSDHLSTQNREQPRTVAPPGYVDPAPARPRAIDPAGPDRTAVTDQATDPRRAGNTTRDSRTEGGNTFGARLDKGSSLLEIEGATRNQGSGTTTPPGNTGAAIDQNLEKALAERNGSNTEVRPIPPGNGGLADGSRTDGTGGGATNDPRNNAGGATSPVPPIPAAEPVIHYTQPRETLWSLSQRYYGDGKYFAVIAKANPDKLLANGHVRDGVRLIIPNKSLVVPAPTGPTVNGTGTGPTNPGTNPGNPASPAVRTVKVESGDTLGEIAFKHLGSSKLINQIIEANKDQIHNANDIKVGMVLKLPAAAPAPGAAAIGPSLRTEGERRVEGATPVAPGAAPSSGNSGAAAAAGKPYKVQPGDTFTSIARTRLGSDRRWKELFELNKAKVGDPEDLRDGMVLVLPADAR